MNTGNVSEKRNRFGNLISNLSTTFIANLISLLGSVLITFLLPAFIGIEEYGYYQLYIFYSGYVGFLGFGWHEGMYLRLGGEYYNCIDKSLYKAQWKYYSIFETIVAMIISIAGIIIFGNSEKSFVFCMVGACIFVYLPRAFLHNILQAVNKVKEYATGVIIEKAVHICITFILVLLKNNSFSAFIISELVGRACACIYIFIVCKDIVLSKSLPLHSIITEVKSNIKVGISLMLANVASLLIVGIVRQGIEIKWGVETFGKISLTLSISNLLMVFVRAVSVVFFPMLRRVESKKLDKIYSDMRACLITPMLFFLAFCYPLQLIAAQFLPQYSDTLKYIAILFPLCLFESKTSMLTETFMKILRKEKMILLVNGITVFLSLISTVFFVFVMENINLAIFSIIFLSIFRSVLGELLLSRSYGFKVVKHIILEVIMTVMFIVFNWFIGEFTGCLLYLAAYIVYIFFNKNQVNDIITLVKSKRSC